MGEDANRRCYEVASDPALELEMTLSLLLQIHDWRKAFLTKRPPSMNQRRMSQRKRARTTGAITATRQCGATSPDLAGGGPPAYRSTAINCALSPTIGLPYLSSMRETMLQWANPRNGRVGVFPSSPLISSGSTCPSPHVSAGSDPSYLVCPPVYH